jgi:signal transduction histidine kinase
MQQVQTRGFMISGKKIRERFLFKNIPEEEKERRRRMTANSVLMVLVAAVAALLVSVIYFYFVLSPAERANDVRMHLLITTSIAAIGLFVIMLGINQIKAIPYWVSSTIFIFMLIILGLFSDTPQEIMGGQSTLFFMIPMLLAGVLIHSYATFFFATAISVIFLAYSLMTDFRFFNPLTVITFYLFAGIFAMIFRSLEKSTYQVRREAAQSQTILSQLRGGFMLLDKAYCVLRANEAALGVFPSIVEGRSIFEVIQDPNVDIQPEDLETLTNSLKSDEVEAQIKIDGRYFFVRSKTIPTSENHIVFLRENTAEVELNRLKDTTLAMVSHELRTPLTAIRGHAELAMSAPHTAVSNAARILLNTQRLMSMVENILSQTRLRTGKIENNPTATNINELFSLVKSMLSAEAKEKHLEFTWIISEDMLPVVMIDKTLLQQILINLANNAIKFTRKDGYVRVTAFRSDDAEWSISVKDNGVGIPASKRSEIFNEFFQAHENTSVYDRPHQGTGLGLSIVKGLVDRMDGKLKLESTEGAGTEFFVAFPLILPGDQTIPLVALTQTNSQKQKVSK